MNNFVFQNPTKIYFGKNQLSHLKEEIKQFGSNVLLVYGGGSIKRIGLYDKVMATLKEAGVNVSELSGVEPNPRHTTVNRGADICKKNISMCYLPLVAALPLTALRPLPQPLSMTVTAGIWLSRKPPLQKLFLS